MDLNNVMDLSLASSNDSTRPGIPTETNCERLISIKNDIEKFGIVVENTKAGLKTLLFAGIPENDPTILDHNRRLEEYQRLQQLAILKINLMLRIEQATGSALTGTAPTHSKDTTNKTPKPNSDTANNGTTKLLPPPVFLEISNEYRDQMKVLNKKFPALRSKMTGEYFKLYTDTDEQYYDLQQFLENTDYRFFSITPKKDRPIKVVIKGLPRDTDTSDIHKDLIEEGFTIIKVTQLVGKITKQKLPVFLISLPRNIHNAKIFDLKKLSYVSINVEGYDNKGVTQCYSCNKFNHTADNCRLTPRCLKYGESHQTR
ncbi:uncharacterized protein TNCV_452951 [Trichonephila clavipes]|nr:uncharacterized protein TNCV_452951 [Trichonephila clavipes]